MSLLAVAAPAHADADLFVHPEPVMGYPHSGSTVELRMILQGDGRVRAQCMILNGNGQRRIRGCNILDAATGQAVTQTADIEPDWPAYTVGRADAVSHPFARLCGHTYYVGILFDYSTSQRIPQDSLPEHARQKICAASSTNF